MSGPFAPAAPQPRYDLCTESQLLTKREEYEQDLNYLARCIDALRHAGNIEAMEIQRDVYYATQRRLDRINALLGQ